MVEYPRLGVFGGVPAPMLARLEMTLRARVQWRYEPKFDGFRGLLWRAPSGAVQLFSGNLKGLSRSFAALVAAGKALPPNMLVDGEIVIANAKGHSDFGALQQRLGVGNPRRAVQPHASLRSLRHNHGS